MVPQLIEVPRHTSEAVSFEPQIDALARDLAMSRDVLYLGRGTCFPLALEGARSSTFLYARRGLMRPRQPLRSSAHFG